MTRRSLRRSMQTVGERTNKELFRKIQSLWSRAGKRIRMSDEKGGPEFIGSSGKGYCIDTPGGKIWMEEARVR